MPEERFGNLTTCNSLNGPLGKRQLSVSGSSASRIAHAELLNNQGKRLKVYSPEEANNCFILANKLFKIHQEEQDQKRKAVYEAEISSFKDEIARLKVLLLMADKEEDRSSQRRFKKSRITSTKKYKRQEKKERIKAEKERKEFTMDYEEHTHCFDTMDVPGPLC